MVWGAADGLARLRAPRWLGPALAGAVALPFALVTHGPLRFWTDDVTLWKRTVAVTCPNFFAETELGIELTAAGERAEALAHYERALEIHASWPRAHANYAFALFLSGDPQRAVGHFERALEIEPEPTGN